MSRCPSSPRILAVVGSPLLACLEILALFHTETLSVRLRGGVVSPSTSWLCWAPTKIACQGGGLEANFRVAVDTAAALEENVVLPQRNYTACGMWHWSWSQQSGRGVPMAVGHKEMTACSVQAERWTRDPARCLQGSGPFLSSGLGSRPLLL